MAANTMLENNRTENLMDVLVRFQDSNFADHETCELEDSRSTVELIDGNNIPLDGVVQRAFTDFGASFESATTAICFALYELAVNPKVQSRLQEEIDLMVEENPNDITYGTIERLPYLNKVVAETLKKYPLLPSLRRECCQRSPSSMLQKRIAQLLGLQHHSDDGDFKTEWFSQERSPYNCVDLGRGPRLCFGMRMALLQIKISLVYILYGSSVRMADNVAKTVKFASHHTIPQLNSGFPIQFQERL